MSKQLVEQAANVAAQPIKQGKKNTVKIVKGQHLRVQELDPEPADAGNLIGTKQGADLHLKYADGTEIVVENFFIECSGDVCSITLPGENAGGYAIGGDAVLGETTAEGAQLVYAYGDQQSLMELAGSDEALSSAFAGSDEGVMSYLPAEAGASASSAAAGNWGWLLAGAGGLGGLAAAAGGGSGGSSDTAATTGGSSDTAADPNTVSGSIVAGPVIDGNGLTVEIYAADGTTKLGESGVDNKGNFTVDVGTYTGVVIARVIDGDDGADYIDEATGVAVNLSAKLMMVGEVGAGQQTLNINPLTTVAAIKAGVDATTGVPAASLDATAVNSANSAVARVFGLDNLLAETVTPTVTDAGEVNTSFSSYGAALASLSGMDAKHGNAQATIDFLAQALDVESGTLSADAQAEVVLGAASVVAKHAGLSGTDMVGTISDALATSSSVSLGRVATDGTIIGTEAAEGVTLSGTNAEGATVVLTIGSKSYTAEVDGTSWSYTLTADNIAAMGQGAETITVTATLEESVATASRTIWIDTVVDAPSLALSEDSGNSDSDGITNNGTVNVTGLETLASFKYSTDGGTEWQDGSGTSVQLTGDGVHTVQVRQTDALGNISANSTELSFTLDTTAPTLSIDTIATDNSVNGDEKTTGVTITGSSDAEDGQTVTIAWGDTSKTATVSAGVWSVTFDSAAVPADGSTSVSADVSDVAGNTATQAVQAVTVDSTAPTVTVAYSVDENTSADTAAKSITLAADETVTWSGLEGTDADSFTLNDGELTFTGATDKETKDSYSLNVTATDTAGNSTIQAITVTIDNVNEAPVVDSGIANQTFVVGEVGEATFALDAFSDVDAGDTLTYTATLANGDALPDWLSFDANTRTFSGTAPADATISVEVTATDGTLSATETFDLTSVTAPSVASFTVTDASGSAAVGKEGDTLSFVVTLSEAVTVTGSPEITFTLGNETVVGTYASGSNTNSLTFTGTAPVGDASTVTLTSIDLNGATVVGNTSAQAWTISTVGQTASYTLDNIAPTLSIDPIASDNMVNGSEKAAGVTIAGSVDAEDGQTVTVEWGDTSKTATVTDNAWSVIFNTEEVPADGNTSVTADVNDLAGNAATQAVQAVTVDSSAPTLSIDTIATDNIVNGSEKSAGVTVSGSSDAEDGQEVTVEWGDSSKTATVSNGAWSVTFAEGEVPADGNTSVSADVSDVAGNAATQAVQAVTVDSTVPTLGIDAIATDNIVNGSEKSAGVTVSGSSDAEDGQEVTVEWGDTSKTATVTDNAWSVNFDSSEVPADGNTSVTADVSDVVGNAATQALQAVTVDSSAPTLSIEAIASDNIVNGSEKSAGVTVSGSSDAEDGQEVTVEWGDTSKTATVSNGAWSVTFAEGEVPADGNTSVSADVSDAAGNAATQAVQAVTVDSTAPTLGIDAIATDNIVNGSEKSAGVTITGSSDAENGQTVTVAWGDTSKTATVTAGTWSVNFDSSEVPADGNTSVTADVSDVVGNAATQALQAVTVDSSAPTLSIDAIASDNIVNGSEKSAGVTVSGSSDAEDGQEVTVEWGDTSKTATVSAGTWNVTFDAVEVPADGNSSVSADVSDLAGNAATQAVQAVTVESIAPSVTAAYSVDENTSTDTALRSITLVVDETVTWSNLAGSDASSFTLNEGVLTFTGATDKETKGSYSLNVTATDTAGNSTTQAITVDINDVNEAPVVANAIADQAFVVGEDTDFTFAVDAFSDEDDGDTLAYTAALVGGDDLPNWLSFDADTRTFSGTPTAETTVSVQVTATDGSLSATDTFDIAAVTEPVISTILADVTNLDVRSNIVLSVDQEVLASSGGVITLTDLGGTGFQGESTTNTQTIDVTDTTQVTIVNEGGTSTIIVDPQFDLDLSSNYSLAVSTGAFSSTATGQGTVAFSTVNFSTVTPGVGIANAEQAQNMSDTGVLEASLEWFDATDIGSLIDAADSLDFSVSDYAAVVNASVLTEDNTVFEGDGHMTLADFGADDLFYVDNQDNSNSDAQASLNGNVFAGGVGTAEDPFFIGVGGTGSLGAYQVNFQLDSASQASLPADVASNQLLEHVLSTSWSNTGMVIAG